MAIEDVDRLTPAERASAAWQRLSAYMNKRMAMLRARNDGLHEPDKTNALRGQIAELRHLLSLASDKPVYRLEDELFKD